MHNFVSQHCWQSAWKKWRHLTQVLRRVGGQLGLIHQLLARSWEWCFRTEEHLGEGGLHCCFCFGWSFVAGGGDWLLPVGCSLQRLCRSSWFFPLRRCWACCRSSSPLTWSPPPRHHLKEKNCENSKIFKNKLAPIPSSHFIVQRFFLARQQQRIDTWVHGKTHILS